MVLLTDNTRVSPFTAGFEKQASKAPTTTRKGRVPTTIESLGPDPSPAELADETPVLADTSTVENPFRESSGTRPQPLTHRNREIEMHVVLSS